MTLWPFHRRPRLTKRLRAWGVLLGAEPTFDAQMMTAPDVHLAGVFLFDPRRPVSAPRTALFPTRAKARTCAEGLRAEWPRARPVHLRITIEAV